MRFRRISMHRTPEQVHEVRSEERSVEHLQELYTVAVGLALTLGVERLVSRSDADWRSWVCLVAFVATLLPFYHGAMRHLDHSYIFPDRNGAHRRGILLLDFVLLFIEACLFIAMAALVHQPLTFLWIFVAVLSVDVAWLETFLAVARRGGNQGASILGRHERGWVLVNVPFIIGGVCLAVIGATTASESSWLFSAILGVVVIARTVADYTVNWEVYFPVEP